MEEHPPGKAEEGGHGAEHEARGGGDPTHHIQDQVLFGINAKTGQITSRTYDEHGEPVPGYAPRVLFEIGALQCKAEFTKHMLSVTVVAALTFALAMLVVRRVVADLRASSAARGPLANLVEAILVYVRDEIVVPVGGHHLGHYTPLFLTYFLFILTANLLGMVPWPPLGAATGNISVTMALGGSVYALVWILGMAHQGPLNYLRHQVPPGTPWWMWLLMFVLEMMGPAIKCFVLCVRLFANMIAGHLIIGTVLGLGTFGVGAMMPAAIAVTMLALGIPLALGISMLELLVAVIQAYVFTLLAVVFIGAAVHPQH